MSTPDLGGADMKARAAEGVTPAAPKSTPVQKKKGRDDVWSVIISYFNERSAANMASVNKLFSSLTENQWKQFAADRNLTGIKDKKEFMERLHKVNGRALSFFSDTDKTIKSIKQIKNPLAQNLMMQEMLKKGLRAEIQQIGDDISSANWQAMEVLKSINKHDEDETAAIRLAFDMGLLELLTTGTDYIFNPILKTEDLPLINHLVLALIEGKSSKKLQNRFIANTLLVLSRIKPVNDSSALLKESILKLIVQNFPAMDENLLKKTIKDNEENLKRGGWQIAEVDFANVIQTLNAMREQVEKERKAKGAVLDVD